MKGVMSKIHLDILDEKQQVVFSKLSFFKRYGYLARGTALALQIQHRKSFDFDVFVKKSVDRNLKNKIKKVFGNVTYYVDTSDQVSFKTKDDISVTFVWYPYLHLFSLVRTSSISLSIVNDIAADKAHTIGRRAVWRDYVDLFILLRKRFTTLKQICGLAGKKFGGEFNEALFLEQFCYFKDLSISPIEFLKDQYTPKEIQSFLEKEIKKYLVKIV